MNLNETMIIVHENQTIVTIVMFFINEIMNEINNI